MNTEQLRSILASMLARPTPGGQPMIVSLAADATVFRPVAGRTPGSGFSWEALMRHEVPWMPVGRFSGLVDPGLGSPAMSRWRDGWAGALLPYLAAFACDWAGTLARQMAAQPACAIRRGGIDAAFRSGYAACLQDASRSVGLNHQTMDALLKVLKSPPTRRIWSAEPAMLRTEPEGESAQVIWLARDGKEVARETLDQLLSRVGTEAAVTSLLGEAEALRQRQAEHRALGDRTLEVICPAAFEAVRRAREQCRQVGLRVCSARVKGLPAEVYVFVGPGPDALRYASATLVARRAHEEFALENRIGQWFYFPPVQLQATFEFIPASPPWQVPRPTIRMPANQPRWIHPYTGCLHNDRFAEAEILSNGSGWQEAGEAMVGISQEAQRLLPALAQYKLPAATAGGMCLGGQDTQTSVTAGQIRQAEATGAEPNLLRLVWGLWDVTRVGLTRGHQNNSNTPIAELGTGQMLYLIPSAAALAGLKLTGRTFPYNRGPWPGQ